MNTGQLARADQLRAALREAERPMNVFTLHRAAGGTNEWAVRDTLVILNELVRSRDLELEHPCCLEHALWVLPADR